MKGDERNRTAVCARSNDPAYERLRLVLEDIATGSWNTGIRVLDTGTRLTANEYARAALGDTPLYEERRDA